MLAAGVALPGTVLPGTVLPGTVLPGTVLSGDLNGHSSQAALAPTVPYPMGAFAL